MFHHVLCQELEALQWWLAASRLTTVTGRGLNDLRVKDWADYSWKIYLDFSVD